MIKTCPTCGSNNRRKRLYHPTEDANCFDPWHTEKEPMTKVSKEAREKKLVALVKAAVRIAIIRHGLHDDDSEEVDADHIAADVANAIQGIDTCALGPIPEWSALTEERELTALSRKSGTSKLRGKPLDDNGAISFESISPAGELTALPERCPTCDSADPNVRGEVFSDSSLYDFRECYDKYHNPAGELTALPEQATEVERLRAERDEYKREWEAQIANNEELVQMINEGPEAEVERLKKALTDEIERNTGPTGGWLCSPKKLLAALEANKGDQP